MKKLILSAALASSLLSVNTFAAETAAQGMLVWDGLVTGVVMGSDITITGANGGELTKGTIQFDSVTGTFTSLMPITAEAHPVAAGVVDTATLFSGDVNWTLVNATVSDANYSNAANLIFNVNGTDVPYVAGTVLTDKTAVLNVQVRDDVGPADPLAVAPGLLTVSATITAASVL